MINILLTGSSGYLGSEFIKAYSDKYKISKFSLQLQKFEDINFYNINSILHCAGIVHQGNKASSESYQDVNVNYPVHLAKLAKANGVKQFIFISSVAVYGTSQYIDELSTCNPCNDYGQCKLEAEKELLKLNDSNFLISIIRIPMIYGSQAPGNIKAITKLVHWMPIIPLGNINNKRSFISIQNLVYCIHNILKQQKEGVFLLADDECISTSNLIKALIKNNKKKRILLNGKIIEFFIRNFTPTIHNKLWGDLVIDASLSKKELGLDLPIIEEFGFNDI